MLRRTFGLAIVLAGCAPGTPSRPAESSGSAAPARFLYVWAGDTDERDPDFLAVVDVRPGSSTYAQVLSTVPVGMRGSMPHHLEYQLPPSNQLLFANGHHHEAIFLIDFADAEHPRVVRTLTPPPPLRYPHDFVRLPNGRLLVGYLRSEGPSPQPGDTTMPGGHGGLAEVDSVGNVLTIRSAADSTVQVPIRPYAFAILPELDRFLVTSALMLEDTSADVIQVWRLSDLTLLRTVPVPEPQLPDGRTLQGGNGLPFEPRVLPDGRSVFMNSYRCGFYHITGIDTDHPTVRSVYAIDTPDQRGACGVPVMVGPYWIMTVGRAHMLVSLDIRDPARPIEVSRLVADTLFRPHWLAKDPGSDRLIVGGENGGESRMLMARVDERTGRLSWDESFRSPDGALGISFVREQWPHGATGEAFGHAALFRP
jgi:hypothetical protein